MGHDLTRAYFWPVVNKGPSCLWPGNFMTRPFKIFLTQIENFGILGGNFSDPEVAAQSGQGNNKMIWPNNNFWPGPITTYISFPRASLASAGVGLNPSKLLFPLLLLLLLKPLLAGRLLLKPLLLPLLLLTGGGGLNLFPLLLNLLLPLLPLLLLLLLNLLLLLLLLLNLLLPLLLLKGCCCLFCPETTAKTQTSNPKHQSI